MNLFIPPEVASRDLSRNVLAQNLAATITDAACAEQTRQWNAWERAYEQARTRAQQADALAEPAAMCATCPAIEDCADLAELTGYTGIAGGHAYIKGRRRHAARRLAM